MHILQKRILKQLSQGTCARYKSLKPSNIQSNQFSYHLKSLVRQGYVEKEKNEYCLSTKGLEFCTSVNFEYFFVRAQPKIVTILVCRDKEGRYLLYQRNKQPFIGMYGFPYGKIHMGESIQNAAERELKEKTGLTAQLKQKGMMYLTVLDAKGEIIAHMLCHVFVGKNIKGEQNEGGYGKLMWVSKRGLSHLNIMPGVSAVLEMSERKSSTLQFEEHVFERGK